MDRRTGRYVVLLSNTTCSKGRNNKDAADLDDTGRLSCKMFLFYTGRQADRHADTCISYLRLDIAVLRRNIPDLDLLFVALNAVLYS